MRAKAAATGKCVAAGHRDRVPLPRDSRVRKRFSKCVPCLRVHANTKYPRDGFPADTTRPVANAARRPSSGSVRQLKRERPQRTVYPS